MNRTIHRDLKANIWSFTMMHKKKVSLLFSYQDRFADEESLPPLDSENNYELTGWEESGGKTVLKFKRKFNTCDTKDRNIEV